MENKSPISVLVINPFNKTIQQKEISGSLESFYKEIDCRSIDVVRFDESDVVYIDDEGLLIEPEKQAYFSIEGYPQPLAGIGVVAGTSPEGDTVSCEHNIFQIGEKVRFLTLKETVTNSDEQEVIYTFV